MPDIAPLTNSNSMYIIYTDGVIRNMAWVFGGKHFGQFTYEHWFDDEYTEVKTQNAAQEKIINNDFEKDEVTPDPDDNTVPHKPRQPL